MNIIKTSGKKSYDVFVDGEDYPLLSRHTWFIQMPERTVVTKVGGTMVSIYKLIMPIRGNGPKREVDHINKNRLDNRKENLRICSRKQNSYNRGLGKNNKSGFKGVYWCSQKSRWKAVIVKDGRRFSLGSFLEKEKAALAYNKKAVELFGDFAWLNPLTK